MQERNLRVLEFTKIRERLSEMAVSAMGRERISQLVPSSRIDEVRTWQQETEEAGNVISYTGGNPIPEFSDINNHLKMASVGGTLSPKALLQVGETLRAARSARSALVTEREDTPLITGLARQLFANRALEEEIFNAILSEDEISDHASPELASIRRHIRQCNDKVRDKLNAIIHNPNM